MEIYLWIKALHIVAVIAWMAGILYLPRLFVYHAMQIPGSEVSETFKIMERRLLRFIMNPAMIISFALGGWLILINPGLLEQPWMQYKVIALVIMTGFHASLSRWRRFFAIDQNTFSPRFFRVINEVPTVLMIIIVLLAVLKP
ncbi:MAG: TIGR00701 family protein [Rhodospirillaceae bacterium]|nr:TIGR00701 family protein [Rhodospirillaceae bacterium]|tara:strand:- start:3156 stop:3584 length:429 start_codon:yes stop_codon:yes gene_type:complete